MNGKKAKQLRRNLAVKTALVDYVVDTRQKRGVTVRLMPGHPRVGYRAAKRVYNSHDSMVKFFKQVV